MVVVPPVIEDFHDTNWCTAKVFYKTQGKVKPRIEIINKKTEMRYVHEETLDTALKAGLLATMGIPFYTLANVACQVIRAVTLFFSLLIPSLVDLIGNFSSQSISNLVVNLTYEVPKMLIKTIWSIVKAPFCAIAMEFCAICATVAPLTWRVHLGDVERVWRGTDRLHHILGKDGDGELDRLSDFFTNPDSEFGFFLAYCFQPWGSLRDSNIVPFRDGRLYDIITPNA